MPEDAWTDRIVGERMTIDSEFSPRVADSRFSSQEWNLIMTATEFEIDDPDDPASARLVANTENVEQILPELETVRSQLGGMGGPPADGRDAGTGVIDSLKGALGLGSDAASYDEERAAAEKLTDAYAAELQSKLESEGRWQDVCELAAES